MNEAAAPPPPRRSALYMPGSNPRALEKAQTLAADVLIFDLEDAVAPDAKEAARTTIRAAFRDGDYGARERVVRINAPGTPWAEHDIALVREIKPEAILIPKVETPEIVRRVFSSFASGSAPAIWCMIETPLGVLRADSIAALEHVGVLVMGTTDLVTDLHAQDLPGRAPLAASLSHCVLAARAHGRGILDGVHMDLTDDTGFEAACRQGRAFGFDGKTLIHPKTIATANTVFGPDEAEVADARRVIEAQATARARGEGVIVLDGLLVEALHVAAAERTIAMADVIAQRDPAFTK
jgi:citrate lyase subunit beta/citryl-CoA lyase